MDSTLLDRERNVLADQARASGKPEDIIAKMVEGRLRNFYSEKVLLEQPFVKDDSKTVGQIAKDAGMKVKRFSLELRWTVALAHRALNQDDLFVSVVNEIETRQVRLRF